MLYLPLWLSLLIVYFIISIVTCTPSESHLSYNSNKYSGELCTEMDRITSEKRVLEYKTVRKVL